MRLWLRYEFRAPGIGTPAREQYAVALEQVAWAEQHGFDTVFVAEHHGSPDGFCPSPMLPLAAMAARTERIRLMHCAAILPLHDPLRVAEDALVLNALAGPRVDVVAVAGWVPSEFAMFGKDLSQRAELLDEGLPALQAALRGETFDYRGRPTTVTPRPVGADGPRFIVGGALRRSARRAAAFGDGFFPTVCSDELIEEYENACAELGKEPGAVFDNRGPLFVHVTEDPERAWNEVAPYLMHEANAYADWYAEATASQADANIPITRADSVAALQAMGVYCVVTPAECVTLAKEQSQPNRMLVFSPLAGGLPPEMSWASLTLFADEVLPLIGEPAELVAGRPSS
jgi:alkanesulfonate monooxygenase SsuD/methylene tetrahydromethanopterin reductase-like flavin-dependent oxidoreductase (luciferase family)